MEKVTNLMPYEIDSLQWVAENFGVEEEILQGFASSLSALAWLYLQTLKDAKEFREGRVVILGLLNQAHHWLAGGLTALQSGNGVVWSACLRGLIEVFGSTVLIRENPGKVVNHLGEISAGKLYSAAHRSRPGFKEDLERLHSVVHPGTRSMYLGVEPTNPETREVRLEFGLRAIKKADGRESVIVLANMAGLLEESLGAIATDCVVLRTGRIVMQNNGKQVESPFR
jgi:hypothetical protein